MKKIALYFYSCANLGDDLFVKTLADYFHDCKIRLIANPKCVPQGLGSNVTLHPHSFSALVFRKLQSVFGENSRTGVLAGRCNKWCIRTIAKRNDAYVCVGGSVFMEYCKEGEPLDFSAGELPKFGMKGGIPSGGNSFIMGANLGPVYSDNYWQSVRQRLSGFTHVCLRDWSSYSRVRDLPNVQYAPDILFLVPQPQAPEKGENVVISLVQIERHTENAAVVDAYYRLMADAVTAFSDRGIPVTLVSFCRWEDDEQAIDRVTAMVPEAKNVSRLCYTGDTTQILEAFSGASYVVGSRFHSMILGISFGKPVFPVSYNCKTVHYLQDLGFSGNYADLKNMTSLTVEDLLYNYDHRIVTDCTAHKKHAADQFRALQRFLGLKEREDIYTK